MKCSDEFKLAYREFAGGKRECVLSVLIHAMLLVGVLFSFTMFLHISGIGDSFLGASMNAPYDFQLTGFSGEDTEWLREREITISVYDDAGIPTYGKVSSLRRIWLTKFQAILAGKDIWSAELDDALTVLLFLHLLFAITAIVLWVVWANTMYNSWAMKAAERKTCIDMYYRLGMSRGAISGIYFLYFVFRELLALLLAVGVNALVIFTVNRFVTASMNVTYRLPKMSLPTVSAVAVLAVVFLTVGCLKMRGDERVGEG